MSSEMRYTDDDLRVIVQDWSESDPDQAVAINLARECLRHRALLARTEAGADECVVMCPECCCHFKAKAAHDELSVPDAMLWEAIDKAKDPADFLARAIALLQRIGTNTAMVGNTAMLEAAPVADGAVDSRAAFERWAKPQGYRLHIRDIPGSPRLGQYGDDSTQAAWEAWTASRTAHPQDASGDAVTEADIVALVAGPYKYHHKMDEQAEREAKAFDRCRELTIQKVQTFFAMRAAMQAKEAK